MGHSPSRENDIVQVMQPILDYIDDPFHLINVSKSMNKHVSKCKLTLEYTETFKLKPKPKFRRHDDFLLLFDPIFPKKEKIKCSYNGQIIKLLQKYNFRSIYLKQGRGLRFAMYINSHYNLKNIDTFILQNNKRNGMPYGDSYQHVITTINDDGLASFTGIKNLILNTGGYINTTLDISDITDNGLYHLRGIEVLHLEGIHFINHNTISNDNITNVGISYLEGIRVLRLPQNINITDDGLKYLAQIQILDLKHNCKITFEGLKHIIGCVLTNKKLKYDNKIVRVEDL